MSAYFWQFPSIRNRTSTSESSGPARRVAPHRSDHRALACLQRAALAEASPAAPDLSEAQIDELLERALEDLESPSRAGSAGELEQADRLGQSQFETQCPLNNSLIQKAQGEAQRLRVLRDQRPDQGRGNEDQAAFDESLRSLEGDWEARPGSLERSPEAAAGEPLPRASPFQG